ncbi:MAG: alpha/beta hydrolase [Acidimicrobiales bacterium]|nr:alpha/beta hydrolase [Acidimicrobiales bacterium]
MTSEAIQLTIGDLTFDAVAEGPPDGTPVLLLHGFPETAHSWRKVQPQLAAAGYRTVAPDLRGYSPGARPSDPAEYTMAILAGDVVALADALGWETFHLLGHDWGGAVAWHVAGRFPDRVRTLSVASTPHPVAFSAAKTAGPSSDGDDQASKSGYIDTFRAEGAEELLLADDGALLALMLAASGLDDESADHYTNRFDTAEKLTGPLNWYRGAEPSDAAGSGPITMPTLYVWSTEDIAFGRTAAELTGGQVDGPYTFEVLQGVSHWVPEAAPDELAGFVLTHLAANP